MENASGSFLISHALGVHTLNPSTAFTSFLPDSLGVNAVTLYGPEPMNRSFDAGWSAKSQDFLKKDCHEPPPARSATEKWERPSKAK